MRQKKRHACMMRHREKHGETQIHIKVMILQESQIDDRYIEIERDRGHRERDQKPGRERCREDK